MPHPSENLFYYRPDLSLHAERETITADLCVYGATAAGVIAAVQAAMLGWRVALLNPAERIGGMTSGGLSYTDIGNQTAIGGLAREFYQRVGQAYGVDVAWTFEPHIAERVLSQWLREVEIRPLHQQFLAAVEKDETRLVAVRMESGTVVRARMFIDATYEGDLLAAAGVSHCVGREGNALYGETLNGAQVQSTHQFDLPVDPYVVEGIATSGLLPGIEIEPPVIGARDHRIQAYCFRMCMTDDPAIRLPFPQPRNYDRRWYVLLERYLQAGWREVFGKFDLLRVATKSDTNNHGAVSTDFIGQNFAWPAGSYQTREQIFQAHVAYQQGYHWFLTHDAAVPREIREAYARWGLCRDEFTTTGGWSPQLYVREARRMVSEYIMTEHECRSARTAPDSVGLAAYAMDSHNCRRFVQDGRVLNEGDVQMPGFPPYSISYRSIVPRASECTNLLVPVCMAASHIAYGSIRMEPVFMVLGQSAAIAAHQALTAGQPVQDLPYADLQNALRAAGQILTANERAAFEKGARHESKAGVVAVPAEKNRQFS
ncbi:MAG: xanthan lyase [Verrucomicrobia bacterium]|nr:xanthan lyase [Verrucomicrobiota bacterium]